MTARFRSCSDFVRPVCFSLTFKLVNVARRGRGERQRPTATEGHVRAPMLLIAPICIRPAAHASARSRKRVFVMQTGLVAMRPSIGLRVLFGTCRPRFPGHSRQ